MVQQLATTSAVLVGGGWAYLKYVRGRVYARRAELNVQANLYVTPGGLMAVAKITLVNKGVARLVFEPGAKVAFLYGARNSPSGPISAPEEEKLVAAEIFADHGWVEAQESIAEEAVFMLSEVDWSTLRFEAQVWGRRRRGLWRWRRRARGTRWVASVVVPGPAWRPVSGGPDGTLPEKA
jgi:hypothetical protein